MIIGALSMSHVHLHGTKMSPEILLLLGRQPVLMLVVRIAIATQPPSCSIISIITRRQKPFHITLAVLIYLSLYLTSCDCSQTYRL